MRELVALMPLALPDATAPAGLKTHLLADIGRETIGSKMASPVRPQVLELGAVRRMLIAATVILALGCGALFWQNRALTQQRNQLAAQIQQRDEQLAVARQQWENMLAPATRVIALSGDAAPQASAKLIWDTQRRLWVIHFFNLPALPPDSDYQLWYLTADRAPISAAVFQPTAEGGGEVRLSVPEEISRRLSAIAVSREPQGGSPQPGGPILLKGAV